MRGSTGHAPLQRPSAKGFTGASLFFVAMLTALLCASAALAQQDDEEVVRVNSDLVVLNVTVTDKEGVYVHKLAHKIRGGAGGSDDEGGLENPPDRLADAVSRLAEISDTLNKSVQKTSRLVISAAVIKHSNELIELIKRIRSIQQP